MTMGLRVARVTPAQAADFYRRLVQLQDDLTAQDEGGKGQGDAHETVKINVLVGYFAEPAPAPE